MTMDRGCCKRPGIRLVVSDCLRTLLVEPFGKSGVCLTHACSLQGHGVFFPSSGSSLTHYFLWSFHRQLSPKSWRAELTFALETILQNKCLLAGADESAFSHRKADTSSVQEIAKASFWCRPQVAVPTNGTRRCNRSPMGCKTSGRHAERFQHPCDVTCSRYNSIKLALCARAACSFILSSAMPSKSSRSSASTSSLWIP